MKQVLLPVVLLAVFGVARLEGSGRDQLGARGSAHFGSPRSVGFGAGVRSYRPGFGYRPRGLRFGLRYPRSSYRSRFYYFPGYYVDGYDYYATTGPMAAYDEASQPYYIRTPVPTQRIDCKDAWADHRSRDSLSGTMTRVLELQCENGHTGSTSDPKEPLEQKSIRQIP